MAVVGEAAAAPPEFSRAEFEPLYGRRSCPVAPPRRLSWTPLHGEPPGTPCTPGLRGIDPPILPQPGSCLARPVPQWRPPQTSFLLCRLF